MIYERNLFVQYRSINGKKYLAQGSAAFELDEIGGLVWDSLDGNTPLETIAANIAEEYHVDKNRVLNDITVFINELKENNLIEEVTP